MPPATKTGTSRTCGKISCARTPVETGPMCPPASIPSITIASAPMRTSLRAIASAGAKQSSLAPPSLMRCTAAALGRPPASTTWPTCRRMQASMSSLSCGCSVIRFTPKGFCVSASVPAISASSCSGFMAPQAITPNPPPFEIAATRLRSETQVMAPPMIASSVPRNSRPRRQSRSRRARARSRASASGPACPSAWGWELAGRVAIRAIDLVGVEPVGGVQRAHRELRVLLGDQHAHLDLRGGDHLDVDTLGRERAEHLLGHAGVAAHADADHGDLHHVGIGLEGGEPDLAALRLQHLHRALEVRLAHREGEVGELAVLGD